MLDGLENAAYQTPGGFNRAEMDRMISSLEKREFIFNNVHDDQPPIKFKTRWCLSYLRGPLTRPQIQQLMDPVRGSSAGRSRSRAGP